MYLLTSLETATMLVELSLILSFLWFLITAFEVMTSKRKKKSPPGPCGLPFFGSFFDIDLKNIHLDFLKWKERYGDIVSFKMNGKNFLVLNNIDIIRKAFESDEIGALMSDRPLNFIGENIFFGYKDVLLRRYDDEFMKMKKLMIRSMKLHDYNSDKFQQLMSEELSHILSKFQKTEGKPTEPMDILVPSFCNIIGMLVSRSNLLWNTLWSLCIIHCPLSSISLLCNVYWCMASLWHSQSILITWHVFLVHRAPMPGRGQAPKGLGGFRPRRGHHDSAPGSRSVQTIPLDSSFSRLLRRSVSQCYSGENRTTQSGPRYEGELVISHVRKVRFFSESNENGEN